MKNRSLLLVLIFLYVITPSWSKANYLYSYLPDVLFAGTLIGSQITNPHLRDISILKSVSYSYYAGALMGSVPVIGHLILLKELSLIRSYPWPLQETLGIRGCIIGTLLWLLKTKEYYDTDEINESLWLLGMRAAVHQFASIYTLGRISSKLVQIPEYFHPLLAYEGQRRRWIEYSIQSNKDIIPLILTVASMNSVYSVYKDWKKSTLDAATSKNGTETD